jgi:hypothetical protein
MPGKSRHARGKHPHHSKKSKIKKRQAMSFPQPVAAEAPKQPAAVEKSSPAAVTAPPAKVKIMQYPYITGELRRIGILAGIILVILIVLALVIS